MIGKTIGQYHILEKLGLGGMGEVWLAEDTRLERKVALKFLPHHIAQDEIEKARFFQEAKAAARLKHASIAQVYEIGEDEGWLFIVMEYMEGGSLRDRLADAGGRSLPLEDVMRWILQVADGLAEAHRQGIVHRDIKPDNLMLTHMDDVKITDFGLARLDTATRLTASGATLGTINYMSPEQVVGKEADNRADLFSLGATFYELLTGHQPFVGPDANAIYYSILHDDPEPVFRFRRDIDQSLDLMITKLLQKDPNLRFQHADEVAADIRRITAEYYASIPPTRPRRAAAKRSRRPLGRRGRLSIFRILLGVALVIIAVGIGFLGQQFIQRLGEPSGEDTPAAISPSDSLAASGDSEILQGILGYLSESGRLSARMDSLQRQLDEERRINQERMTPIDPGLEESTAQELRLLQARYDSIMTLMTQGRTEQPSGPVTEEPESNLGDIQVLSPLPGATVSQRLVDLNVEVTPRKSIERLIIAVDGTEQVVHPVGDDREFSVIKQVDLDQIGRHIINVSIEDADGNRYAKPFVIIFALETGTVNVGVLDLENNNVESSEAIAISERLRLSLARQPIFQIIERNRMLSIMEEVGFRFSGACNSNECVVQVGRILGVNKMVAGSVSKVGTMYSLQIRIIDVGTSRIDHQAFADVTGIEEVLTSAVESVSTELAGWIVEQSGEVVKELQTNSVNFITDPPGAVVVVDGQEMGETPLVLQRYTRKYNVKLSKDGFFTANREVDVTAGNPMELRVTLQQLEPINMGVMELEAVNVDRSDARAITDRLRLFLGRQNVFNVIERNIMEDFIEEVGFVVSGACDTDECIIQVGIILGARKMVAGSVSKVGNLYSLQVRLLDIASANIDHQSYQDVTGIEEVLMTATRNIASELSQVVIEGMEPPQPPPSL